MNKKLLAISMTAIIFLTMIILAVNSSLKWLDQRTVSLRDPFQNPVVITLRPTTQAIIIDYQAEQQRQADLTSLVNNIYGLESSYGKNDSCLNQGKFNGYGFGAGTKNGKFNEPCFDTHDQITKIVAAWFNDKLQTLDVNAALCDYNLGRVIENCTYSQNYNLLYK